MCNHKVSFVIKTLQYSPLFISKAYIQQTLIESVCSCLQYITYYVIIHRQQRSLLFFSRLPPLLFNGSGNRDVGDGWADWAPWGSNRHYVQSRSPANCQNPDYTTHSTNTHALIQWYHAHLSHHHRHSRSYLTFKVTVYKSCVQLGSNDRAVRTILR